MKKANVILLVFVFLSFFSFAQNNRVNVGIVGEKFSDFTLKTYQGGEFSTDKLQGKNLLLISSRGKYTDKYWCGICYYQYAEFANLQTTKDICKKYNMEIVFLLPYNRDSIVGWEKNFANGLAYIEHTKHPADTTQLSAGEKNWIRFAQKHFPKSFSYPDNKIPLTLPILMDEKQEVSKGLDISRTEWDGTKTLQNVPLIYYIDKNGILQFKYISQSTADRPTAAYVLQMIEYIQKRH